MLIPVGNNISFGKVVEAKFCIDGKRVKEFDQIKSISGEMMDVLSKRADYGDDLRNDMKSGTGDYEIPESPITLKKDDDGEFGDRTNPNIRHYYAEGIDYFITGEHIKTLDNILNNHENAYEEYAQSVNNKNKDEDNNKSEYVSPREKYDIAAKKTSQDLNKLFYNSENRLENDKILNINATKGTDNKYQITEIKFLEPSVTDRITDKTSILIDRFLSSIFNSLLTKREKPEIPVQK